MQRPSLLLFARKRLRLPNMKVRTPDTSSAVSAGSCFRSGRATSVPAGWSVPLPSGPRKATSYPPWIAQRPTATQFSTQNSFFSAQMTIFSLFLVCCFKTPGSTSWPLCNQEKSLAKPPLSQGRVHEFLDWEKLFFRRCMPRCK